MHSENILKNLFRINKLKMINLKLIFILELILTMLTYSLRNTS